MTDRHPDPDQLVALALAELGQAEQDELLTHLTACPACHAAYTELSDGLQQALAAAPAVAPPPGFSGRVLAAMAPTERAPARLPRPRTRLLVAAAVLLGLLAGVGGTLAITALTSRPGPGAPAHQPVATQLLTSGGDSVGSAGIAMLGGRTFLALNVTSGRPDARYECILVGRDGVRTSGGSWTLTDEYGSGTASGSWLVPVTGDPPAEVQLVAPSGAVWSRARF